MEGARSRGKNWSDEDIKKMLQVAAEININSLFESKQHTASQIYKILAERCDDKSSSQIQDKFNKLRRGFEIVHQTAKKSGEGRKKPTIYDEEMFVLWGSRPKFNLPTEHGLDSLKAAKQCTNKIDNTEDAYTTILSEDFPPPETILTTDDDEHETSVDKRMITDPIKRGRRPIKENVKTVVTCIEQMVADFKKQDDENFIKMERLQREMGDKAELRFKTILNCLSSQNSHQPYLFGVSQQQSYNFTPPYQPNSYLPHSQSRTTLNQNISPNIRKRYHCSPLHQNMPKRQHIQSADQSTSSSSQINRKRSSTLSQPNATCSGGGNYSSGGGNYFVGGDKSGDDGGPDNFDDDADYSDGGGGNHSSGGGNYSTTTSPLSQINRKRSSTLSQPNATCSGGGNYSSGGGNYFVGGDKSGDDGGPDNFDDDADYSDGGGGNHSSGGGNYSTTSPLSQINRKRSSTLSQPNATCSGGGNYSSGGGNYFVGGDKSGDDGGPDNFDDDADYSDGGGGNHSSGGGNYSTTTSPLSQINRKRSSTLSQPNATCSGGGNYSSGGGNYFVGGDKSGDDGGPDNFDDDADYSDGGGGNHSSGGGNYSTTSPLSQINRKRSSTLSQPNATCSGGGNYSSGGGNYFVGGDKSGDDGGPDNFDDDADYSDGGGGNHSSGGGNYSTTTSPLSQINRKRSSTLSQPNATCSGGGNYSSGGGNYFVGGDKSGDDGGPDNFDDDADYSDGGGGNHSSGGGNYSTTTSPLSQINRKRSSTLSQPNATCSGGGNYSSGGGNYFVGGDKSGDDGGPDNFDDDADYSDGGGGNHSSGGGNYSTTSPLSQINRKRSSTLSQPNATCSGGGNYSSGGGNYFVGGDKSGDDGGPDNFDDDADYSDGGGGNHSSGGGNYSTTTSPLSQINRKRSSTLSQPNATCSGGGNYSSGGGNYFVGGDKSGDDGGPDNFDDDADYSDGGGGNHSSGGGNYSTTTSPLSQINRKRSSTLSQPNATCSGGGNYSSGGGNYFVGGDKSGDDGGPDNFDDDADYSDRADNVDHSAEEECTEEEYLIYDDE